jgi:hypothetical protein
MKDFLNDVAVVVPTDTKDFVKFVAKEMLAERVLPARAGPGRYDPAVCLGRCFTESVGEGGGSG